MHFVYKNTFLDTSLWAGVCCLCVRIYIRACMCTQSVYCHKFYYNFPHPVRNVIQLSVVFMLFLLLEYDWFLLWVATTRRIEEKIAWICIYVHMCICINTFVLNLRRLMHVRSQLYIYEVNLLHENQLKANCHCIKYFLYVCESNLLCFVAIIMFRTVSTHVQVQLMRFW